jgi:hypothetical protein
MLSAPDRVVRSVRIRRHGAQPERVHQAAQRTDPADRRPAGEEDAAMSAEPD